MGRIGRQPRGTKGFAKATFDAVPLDGTADFLGHRQANTAFRNVAASVVFTTRGVVTTRDLETAAATIDPTATPNPDEVRSCL